MIDFLVIGGGIAGISAGARLSALGQVTVLEREEGLAYHASGRSAAMFEENYGDPATLALNRASRQYHQEAGVLSPRGLLMLGQPDNAAAFEKDQKDFALDPLTRSEALALVPILNTKRIDRAAFGNHAMDIDTHELLQSFARTLRSNGGQTNLNSEVTQITRIPTGWDVTTKNCNYFAKNLVNAAGAWGDLIAKMAGVAPIGLTPMRRSMAQIPAPGGHDLTGWPMLFGPGETWYAKPDAGRLLVSPADEDPVEPHDAFSNELTLAEGLMHYENHVTERVVNVLSSWAGLRTFAPDRTLVIGPDAGDDTFIWCAGQGGYGMQSAPGASQLLGDLIGGTQPVIGADAVAALSPVRFAA